jgi:hypothetical protein
MRNNIKIMQTQQAKNRETRIEVRHAREGRSSPYESPELETRKTLGK